MEATGIVKQDGSIVRRGVRAKVGVYADRPDDFVLHGGSGRADYFGTLVNRSARLLACASSGQIIGPREHIFEALEYWKSPQEKKRGGLHTCTNHSDASDVSERRSAPTSSEQLTKYMVGGGLHTRMSPVFGSHLSGDAVSSGGGGAWTSSMKAPWMGQGSSTSQTNVSGVEGSQKSQACVPQTLFSMSRRTRSPAATSPSSSAPFEGDLMAWQNSRFVETCHPMHGLSHQEGSSAAPAAWYSNGPSASEQCSCRQPAEYPPTHRPMHAAAVVDSMHDGDPSRHSLAAPTLSAASVDSQCRMREDDAMPPLCTDQQTDWESTQQDVPGQGRGAASSQHSRKRKDASSDSGEAHLLHLPPASAALQSTLLQENSKPLEDPMGAMGTLSGGSGQQSPRSATSARAALRSHGLMFQPSMRLANRMASTTVAQGPVAESAGHVESCALVDDADDARSSVQELASSSKPDTRAARPSTDFQVFALLGNDPGKFCPLSFALYRVCSHYPPPLQVDQSRGCAHKKHCLEVLVHAAGVYKLKGVNEPVPVSCVSLADMYQADERGMTQEQLSTKVERISASSELIACTEVTIPVPSAATVGTEERSGSSTVAATLVEKRFKAAYMDFGWSR